MIEGLTLGNYLMLVEQTGRKEREGKSSISPELADLFDRLGTNESQWQNRMDRLTGGKLVGNFIASSRARLRQVASTLGVRHLVNLYAETNPD